MLSLRHAVGLFGMIAATALAGAGCGGAAGRLPREPISGTVTFDGRPLKKGTVQFQPTSQVEGTMAGGAINDGRFDVPAEEGPVPGKYSVAIFDQDEAAAAPSPAPGEMPGPPSAVKRREKAIPPRYNTKTELTADVKAGGPNAYTFDLKK